MELRVRRRVSADWSTYPDAMRQQIARERVFGQEMRIAREAIELQEETERYLRNHSKSDDGSSDGSSGSTRPTGHPDEKE